MYLTSWPLNLPKEASAEALPVATDRVAADRERSRRRAVCRSCDEFTGWACELLQNNSGGVCTAAYERLLAQGMDHPSRDRCKWHETEAVSNGV